MNSRSIRTLCAAVCAAFITLATSEALGQVEGRCPTGWEVLPIMAGEGQRPIVACVREPMQLAALQFERAIPPGEQIEGLLAMQLTVPLGFPPTQGPPTFRSETIAGRPVRITEITGTGELEDGSTVRLAAVIALVPVGNTTVVVRGVTQDAAHANVGQAVRAFIPTLVGLDGSIPAWRASATCPPGTTAMPAEAPPANGTRRVVQCAAEGRGTRIDVLESRLPVRNAQEARAAAQFHRTLLERSLGARGATVTAEELQPVTLGAIRGFAMPVHVALQDPRVPPGSPGATTRAEARVLVIPTPVGHVEVFAMSGEDPAALASQVQSFVTTQLRLDGAGVPPAAVDAGMLDAGVAAGAGANPANLPRRREIDPNLPLWQPPPEERPRASTPPAQSSGRCGCATPGAAPGLPGALSAAALAALLATRRRR